MRMHALVLPPLRQDTLQAPAIATCSMQPEALVARWAHPLASLHLTLLWWRELQVSGLGAAELAVSILGPWARAPRAGRVAYEQYTAAIAALLGGEASTQVPGALKRTTSCKVDLFPSLSECSPSLRSAQHADAPSPLQEVHAAASAAWDVLQAELPKLDKTHGHGSVKALDPIRCVIPTMLRRLGLPKRF